MPDTGTWVWNPQPHIRLSIEINGHTLNESAVPGGHYSLDEPRKWWLLGNAVNGSGWMSKESTALRRFAHVVQTGKWHGLTRETWDVPEDVDTLWVALTTLYWDHPNNR